MNVTITKMFFRGCIILSFVAGLLLCWLSERISFSWERKEKEIYVMVKDISTPKTDFHFNREAAKQRLEKTLKDKP